MSVEVEIGIDHSQFLGSIDSVEDLKHIKAYQLIIAIYYRSHFIPITSVHNRHVDVLQSFLVLCVHHQLTLLLRNIIKIKIFFDDSRSVVCGGIVNHHHFVIRVILGEN